MGGIPCQLCIRRGTPSQCRASTIGPDASVRISDKEPSTKRQRTAESDTLTQIPVPEISRILSVSSDLTSRVVVGHSSTLAFLHFVQSLSGDIEPFPDVMLESPWPAIATEYDVALMSQMQNSMAIVLSQHYCDLVHGIFDLFPTDTVTEMVKSWPSTDPVLLLILAIGAEERQANGDSEIANAFAIEATNSIHQMSLQPPTLRTIQSQVLLIVYLLVTCRRNAAFSQLGMAIASANSIGLCQSPDDASLRAWKCLRVIDISSCASLGRPLTTAELCSPTSEHYQAYGVSHKLCSIAEKILRTVYGGMTLTLDFTRCISQELRDWADALPHDLMYGNDSDLAAINLHHQMHRNHMTAAYFWTIILLTRPFLMNDVLHKRNREAYKPCELSSTFIDACIDSALRCLDATAILVDQPSLCRRPFLVVNTTLVCALTLGLAVFGDYDKHFSLDEGMGKAVRFLEHVSKFDSLADQYLGYVRRIRNDARQYIRDRAAAEWERRSAQVNQIFGSVLQQSEKSGSTSESSHNNTHLTEGSLVYQTQNNTDQDENIASTNAPMLAFSPELYLSGPNLGLAEFSTFPDDMWTGPT